MSELSMTPGRSRSVEEQEEEEEGQSGQQLSSTTAQEENEEQEEEENEEIDEAVRQWRAGGPEARLPDVFDYNANHSADFLDNKMTELLYDFRSNRSKAHLKRESSKILKFAPLIKKYGLKKEHVDLIFDVIISFELASVQTREVIDILLPRENVPENHIVQIIGKFSIKGADTKVINTLLEWAVSVFELIDSTETISRLYGVLFHYLKFGATRYATSHLLYFLTRRRNVTPYRIRRLNEMIENEKDNASLIGLLMVYKRYNPEIRVPENVRLSRMFVFQHPNSEFSCNLGNIKSHWNNSARENELFLYKPHIRLPNPKKAKKVDKRKKEEKERDNMEAISSLSLHEHDLADLLDQVHRLPYSKQLDNVLDDRHIQHLLACNPEDVTIERLCYWIGQKILELTRYNNSKDTGKQEFNDLLHQLLTLTRFAKSQLPIIETFLREYLKVWNGIDFEKEIFELVTYIKPGDYDDLYQDILLPLYRKYYVSDVFWKAKLIMCYTEWLKNWALLDWKGHTRRSMKQQEEEEERTEDEDVDRVTNMFAGLSFNVNYFTTIQKLVEHVDRISVMGFLAENDHPLLQHAALDFFELVALIPLQHDIPEIIIPAANFVHRSFFSSHAMAVSRICGIVCQYKMAFEENDKKSDDWMSRHSSEYLGHFNTYMKDICNSLWRNMGFKITPATPEDIIAFSLTKENIEKFTDICEKRGDELNRVLSITHSSALAGFSKRFMTGIEEEQHVQHNEPVTAESLERLEEQAGIDLDYLEYRVDYLNYLKEMGLTGIHDLLYACMTTLINRKNRAAVNQGEERSSSSAAAAVLGRQSINSTSSNNNNPNPNNTE